MNNKNEQIQALLEKRALKFALKTLGVSSMRNHKYSEVFTVTRAEIDAHVAEHGIPSRSYNSNPNSRYDGLYFYQQDKQWLFYFQERGIRHDEQVFDDETEGQSVLVDWLLKANLTGLDFSHKDDS